MLRGAEAVSNCIKLPSPPFRSIWIDVLCYLRSFSLQALYWQCQYLLLLQEAPWTRTLRVSVCSGARQLGTEAWYHNDINISFNGKLLSLPMPISGIRPEFPLPLKSKTGIIFRIVILVCTDELEEVWRESRCKQVILAVRDVRVTQRKLL